MKELVKRFGKAVKGILTGFDRIVFKGTILPLAHEEGAMSFLRWRGVLTRDYKDWMRTQTEALSAAVDRYAREQGAEPIKHLNTWRKDKDELARQRQQASGVKSGLIGVWSCLESGATYHARYSAEKGYPQLHHERTPCKHLYLYLDHAQYGWMNVRIQTWFPYHIQIALNGRQWLRRSLEAAQIKFLCQGNKFLHVQDYPQAQRFLAAQVAGRWPGVLNSFLPIGFPTMVQTLGPNLSYYWTLWQSEWATDLVLKSPADLEEPMDRLLRHAMLTGNSTRVLRYLGRPVTAAGKPYGTANPAVMSRVLDYHEGLRVRHWVDQNSVKVYNEQNVLRVETTINAPNMFWVHRRAQGEAPEAPKKLRILRKGVADIPLRAQVSQEVNERYMHGLATFSDQTPIRQLLEDHLHARQKQGHRVRPLDITGKDRELLQAISDPRFTVSGITNAALHTQLRHTSWATGRTDKQLAARITRAFRLLRDHGVLRKLPHRRRYQLTPKGTQLTTALNAVLAASTAQLMKIAA